MGLEQKLIAACSPWQNPFVERLIGSIRRECLNHVLMLHPRHLHRVLSEYFQYYSVTRLFMNRRLGALLQARGLAQPHT